MRSAISIFAALLFVLATCKGNEGSPAGEASPAGSDQASKEQGAPPEPQPSSPPSVSDPLPTGEGWPSDDDVRMPLPDEKVEDLPTADGTSIGGGTLSSSRWTLAGSPYRIYGNLVLPEGQTLVVEAGVTIIFMDSYKFSVWGGRLLLEGKAAQPIRLTAVKRDPGWYGILFCPEATCTQGGAKGELVADYAIFEYARANDKEGDFRYWRRGGALSLLNTLKVKISNSIFRYNFAYEVGGALELIAIDNASIAQLDGIKFFGNEAGSGGALRLSHINNRSWSNLQFLNNIVRAWPDSYGGAIEAEDANQINLTRVVARSNTATVNGKSSGLGGAFYCYAPTLTFTPPYDIRDNLPESSVGCGFEDELKANQGRNGQF